MYIFIIFFKYTIYKPIYIFRYQNWVFQCCSTVSV